jgi:hypothetical protein
MLGAEKLVDELTQAVIAGGWTVGGWKIGADCGAKFTTAEGGIEDGNTMGANIADCGGLVD